MTSTDGGGEHAVADEEIATGQRQHSGIYHAMCGHAITPEPLISPPGRPCPHRVAALDQRPPRRAPWLRWLRATMHQLIASPFLGDYLVDRPGFPNGMKIPYENYRQLTQTRADAACPAWLADAALRAWSLDVTSRTLADTVLVRKESSFTYGRQDTCPPDGN